MNDVSKPDPNTYWVVPGKFLAGEYPGAPFPEACEARIQDFVQAGVSFFLDLTQPFELLPYAPFLEKMQTPDHKACVYQNMGIRDFSIPTVDQMREIQTVIRQALADGHCVYVHCWGGVGRTGTVVGCFLVDEGMSGGEALAEVARLFGQTRKATPGRCSPESEEQMQFVRDWERPDRPHLD